MNFRHRSTTNGQIQQLQYRKLETLQETTKDNNFTTLLQNTRFVGQVVATE